MSDRTPAKIDPLQLVSRIDFSLARPPAGLPQFVPVRLAPESAAHTGGRVYVSMCWRIPGRPGFHGIFYCREFSDLEE